MYVGLLGGPVPDGPQDGRALAHYILPGHYIPGFLLPGQPHPRHRGDELRRAAEEGRGGGGGGSAGGGGAEGQYTGHSSTSLYSIDTRGTQTSSTTALYCRQYVIVAYYGICGNCNTFDQYNIIHYYTVGSEY